VPPRRFVLALLIAAVSAGTTGCEQKSHNDGKPVLVATTTQVADIARNVAGDRAHVEQLLHPGSDPHEYEPRPSDAQALATATLVVRSGGAVDDWLGPLLDQAGGDATTLTLLDHVHAVGDDPHWWQDPSNGVTATNAIRDALTKADPTGAATYRANAKRYAHTLQALDARIARCVAKLPPEKRRLVTSHDSLGYYARRYGFTVVGAAIPALSSQAEPSAAATERLVDQIREQQVPAIFPETALNPRLERAIAREAGAKVAGGLYADALGPPGTPGATYAGALAANTDTIVGALSEGRVDCGL
jgi:ABC-type Zn uptake system ZnuABC Zn-binding protein ZnuA